MLQIGVRNWLNGLFCGALGGACAGAAYGMVITIYSNLVYETSLGSLSDFVFPYVFSATLIGLGGGLLLGGLFGLLMPLIKPILLLLATVVGAAFAGILSLLLLNADTPPIGFIVIIGGAAAFGVLGGSIAVKCYGRNSQ